MEEGVHVYLERANVAQEARVPAERTWGQNECCFASACLCVVLSFAAGTYFVYEVSENGGIYSISGLVFSSTTLVAGLCWATHFARKGYNPRAVRPAHFEGAEPHGGLIRMRVVRSQTVQREDADVESAQTSEAHVHESSSPGPSFLQIPEICISDVDMDPVPNANAAPESIHTEDLRDVALENVKISKEASSVDEVSRRDFEQKAQQQPRSRDLVSGELVDEQSAVRLRKSTPVFDLTSPDS